MDTRNPMPEHVRRFQGEHGATLVLALTFLAVFGLLATAILAFGETSVKASDGYRTQRASSYAADGALDGAVNRLKQSPTIGLDGATFPSDPCKFDPTNPNSGDNSANNIIFRQPASGKAPAMVVGCAVDKGSESGQPAETGSAPENAILTLGDRRSTDNLAASAPTGVRTAEPGPFNCDTILNLFVVSCGNTREVGIKAFPSTGSDTATWNVRGSIFSNSRIEAQGGFGPVVSSPPGGPTATVQARGGCSGLTCTDPGWNFADGLGKDPQYTSRIADVPTSSGSFVEPALPSAAACNIGNRVLGFSPGLYTSATALNNLFADSRCKNTTFWFQPGAYYFDFRDGGNAPYTCGSSLQSGFLGNQAHQWCIGGRATDYVGQRVVGGTPYKWDPEATGPSSAPPVTLLPHGTNPFPSFSQFSNPSRALTINCPNANCTSDFTMGVFQPSSSITLSSYDDVPNGNYTSVDLRIAHSGTNVTRMSNPTVQVNYGGFFGGRCGPYTLPKPPEGSTAVINLSAADKTNLSSCLTTGSRINSATVQYNVSRPWGQGSPYPTARLDGIELIVNSPNQPTFPRTPQGPVDYGGDCDPNKDGVQFIFGGDSRVYVPNGSMELCAGPDPANPGANQQIAVYGAPATPRLQPTQVVGTGGVGGGATSVSLGTPNNALKIAEPTGLANAGISYTYPGCFIVCNVNEGNMTLRFPGYSPPSGYSVAKVELRASYNSNNPIIGGTSAQFQLTGTGFPGACSNRVDMPTGGEQQARTVSSGGGVDVTSCLTAGNRIATSFDVLWAARTQCFFACGGGTQTDQLDGIEFVITLAPTSPNASVRPQSGCIVGSPNYWDGMNADDGSGSPDCALIKVDAVSEFFSGYVGRLSIKGTTYAPAATIDVGDADVRYSIFSRGLIARHLRLKEFDYGTGCPSQYCNLADNVLDTTSQPRQISLYACIDTGQATCRLSESSGEPVDPTDLKGRAAVVFSGTDTTKNHDLNCDYVSSTVMRTCVKRWSVGTQ